MTLQLVTFIYDFLYAKCYIIHIVLDRIKSNQNTSRKIKELYIHLIMLIEDNEVPRKIFKRRAKKYFRIKKFGMDNMFCLFAIISTAVTIRLLSEVKKLIINVHKCDKNRMEIQSVYHGPKRCVVGVSLKNGWKQGYSDQSL